MKNIKKLREERGMSKNELARKSSLSPSLIGKLENGSIKSPSIYTISCLAKGLDVDLQFLLES